MSFLLQQPTDEEYKLHIRLQGTTGPINVLAFAPDAKFLASGGDDEKLRIWDIGRKQIYQVIGDELERWGQITCVKWLTGVSDHGDTLCFATGRGLVLIYQRTKEAESFRELSSTAVLPFNEPVEAIDYDMTKRRLVLSSHTGKIKLFQLEKNGTLLALWTKNFNDTQDTKGVIPRSVHFTTKGENVLVFGLESGIMMSKVCATGLDNWSKVLKSSIGNVCFSTDQKWLLVDNLKKGFDLYNYPHSSPSESFPVSRAKAFVQQGIFLEDETSVGCGSDHGKIHIFSLGTSKCLQKLKHGSAKTMVQVLDACSTTNRHLIASGTDERKPDIYIWEKKIKGHQEQQRACGCNSMTVLILLNILFMFLSPALWMSGNGGQNWLSGQYGFGKQVVERPITTARSAKQVLDSAAGLLKRNGIELNDPEQRSNI